jgi:tetratricopeptide (TPR) repeat protein
VRPLSLLIALVLTPPAPAAGPTCALLDPEKTPRAALLEAKLLAEPGATWVERAGIDAVLKEQKLQAAFGPQGVGVRVKLGKLFKADVLVMVRVVKQANAEVLELVVSETAGGLRLLRRAVPVTKSADEDVAALLAAAREGIRKHGEKITDVVAVPPFVSNDLGYQFEHLKGAFAKLAEAVALDRKGVVVVELAEAEALAKEIALAAPGAPVVRPSPLYLVGEYRHEGRGADQTVALKLRAERAGKLVGKPETLAVKADAAPAALRRWAAGVLDSASGRQVALPDPMAEAKRLGELAAVHQRLGNWPEATALIEASLLLDPKQPELNADAMAVLRYRVAEAQGRYATDPDYLTKAAALHRRGFVHMEALLAHGELLPRHRGYGHLPLRVFESTFPFPRHRDPLYNYPSRYTAEQQAVIDELEKDRIAAFRRALPLAAKTGTRSEMEALVKGAVGVLPATEHFAEYAKLILAHQDSKGLVEALDFLVMAYPVVHTADGFQLYRKFLDALDKDGNAGVRDTVRRHRQTLPGVEKAVLEMIAKRAAEEEARLRAIEAAKKAPRPPSTVRFNATRAELDKEIDEKQQAGPLRRVALKAAHPDDDVFVDQLRGSVSAGPGVDVFWAPARFLPPKPGDDPTRPKAGAGGRDGLALFVMKEKGVLKRVFGKPNVPDKVTDMCFDGKYVWVTAEGRLSRGLPALFVLDPVAETVHEVTVADGLPELPPEVANDPRRSEALAIRVAPVDHGRACVAGWFGRAWVGVATFDARKGKAVVKVIHEAKEVPRQGEKEPWLNPNLSFVPDYARTLRGAPGADGKDVVRVLIGRGWPKTSRVSDYLPQMGPHPLAVDPDAGTVETVKDPVRVSGWQMGPHSVAARGSVYVASPPGGGGFTSNLYRIDAPGKLTDLGPLAIPRAPYAHCAVVGDRAYFGVPDFGGERVPQPGGAEGYGSHVWASDLDGKNLRKLADKTLRIRDMRHSSHYGLIAWCDLGDSLTRWVCNEVVDGKK